MSNRRRRRDAEDVLETEQTDEAIVVEQTEAEAQEPVAAEEHVAIAELAADDAAEEVAPEIEETVATVATVIDAVVAVEPVAEPAPPAAAEAVLPSIADLEEEAKKLEERRKWLKRRRR
jgi:hypothetical protein